MIVAVVIKAKTEGLLPTALGLRPTGCNIDKMHKEYLLNTKNFQDSVK